MSDFNRDRRRQQELRLRPAADRIYRKVFGDGIAILRHEHPDGHPLDKEYGIDVEIKLPCNLKVTGQEKFLAHRYASFKSLTVEYEQNQHTGEPGDWFNIAPTFYFVGYETEEGKDFSNWMMADWLRMAVATEEKRLLWQQNRNKNGRARASFRYIHFDALPPECMIARGSAPEPQRARIVAEVERRMDLDALSKVRELESAERQRLTLVDLSV